ncbi:transposase [Mucilaginibacter sp. UR6-11]|uniref:transposase n=1 Tax=Mucilaginibacter sp. UR6-11 TaxID=1435644 RepID=UPI001E48F982|nr:transposase [Mucilaginibacter sp. UR6-11]MCC8423822.1 transposase [Mucilaginibacter sp. UR6-11]
MIKFSWQEGYGVFSYSQSHIDAVAKYVLNQEEHHRKKTFKEEYLDLLEKFQIPFEERFLFDFIDDSI